MKGSGKASNVQTVVGWLKFCPKCGNLLVPIRKGEKLILKCRVCGHEEEATTKTIGKEYTIKHNVEEEKRVKTSKVSEPPRPIRREEEREMLQEYYEIFLETFTEEESGAEE